jgi:hypothetical protein
MIPPASGRSPGPARPSQSAEELPTESSWRHPPAVQPSEEPAGDAELEKKPHEKLECAAVRFLGSGERSLFWSRSPARRRLSALCQDDRTSLAT